jgi:hypothetical protein
MQPHAPPLQALVAALEADVLALVQAAPLGSPAQLAAAADRALELALGAAALGDAGWQRELIGLGCAMERCLGLIGEGLVDPGVALPALAMAADAARFPADAVLAAARYEIETLLPVPGAAAATRRGLDVPASSLVRRGPVAASDAAEPADPRWAQRQEMFRRWPGEAAEGVSRARQRLRSGGSIT